MSTIDYQPLANNVGANVETQAQYLIDIAPGGSLVNGYIAGTAKSNQINKTFRQCSMIAAAVANAISSVLATDVLDDGLLPGLITKMGQLIRVGGTGYAIDTGLANAYVIALAPATTTYTTGMMANFIATHVNSGASTLDAGGGVKTIVRNDGSACVAGDIGLNQRVQCVYDGPADKFYLTSMTVSQATAASGSTGDAKLTFKTAPDVGWIMANDGSIGSGASGASNRANADTLALYTLLWNNITNTFCPVSTGRGANAAADFAANKTLTIPRALGRALAISGTGSGLTARALGEFLGEEAHVQSLGELAAHSHIEQAGATGATGGDNHIPFGGSFAGNANSSNSTVSQGSSTAANVMQPTGFVNMMIRL